MAYAVRTGLMVIGHALLIVAVMELCDCWLILHVSTVGCATQGCTTHGIFRDDFQGIRIHIVIIK